MWNRRWRDASLAVDVGRSASRPEETWTAVSKRYQKIDSTATVPAVPETVTAAMAEVAGDMREGLLSLSVAAGQRVMSTPLAADVSAVCRWHRRHDSERRAVRHVSERARSRWTVGGAGRVVAGARH